MTPFPWNVFKDIIEDFPGKSKVREPVKFFSLDTQCCITYICSY